MHADDPLLIERTARGDHEAFEVLVRRWEGPLARFLERLVGSATLAEDARQLVLLRVYTRAGQYRGGSVRSWIYAIAYSVGLNLRRGELRVSLAPLAEDVPLYAADPLPEVVVGDDEERGAVRRALTRLEEDDRVLLWLRVAEGLTVDETSNVLDLPCSTLRYRTRRALKRLRGELGSLLENGEHHVVP